MAARGRKVRESSIEVDGLAVEVTRRSRQKNVYVRVKPPDGRVCVSAPLSCSDARITAFVTERMPWIEAHRAHMRETAEASGGAGAPSEEELAAWRATLERTVPPLIERWARELGVTPGKLVYRNMVSQWGSCNVRTGRICLNLQLAAQPAECLEYVVVHELCHLIEAGHGPRFKALMDVHLPDWRRRRALLRDAIRR